MKIFHNVQKKKREMIKAGIIGGAGYTAGELVGFFLNHPKSVSNGCTRRAMPADLCARYSGIAETRTCSLPTPTRYRALTFSFLCSGHGASASFWQQNENAPRSAGHRPGPDFRDESCGYVYGLPEINRPRIAEARKVANRDASPLPFSLLFFPRRRRLS